jgi:hypothetical protein
MKKTKKTMLILPLPLLLAGCLVEVRTVADPRPELDRARVEAREAASQPGPATSLQVVAWDPDEHKLVRAKLPLWLVHKAAEHGDVDWGGEVGEDVGERLRRLRLRDLEKAGRGALVEVVDEDGTEVLVWLR